jgi:hypothetical protein
MVRRLLLVCLIGVANAAAAAAQSGHLVSGSDEHLPKPLPSSVSQPIRDLPPQAGHKGPATERSIGRPLAGRPGPAATDPIVQMSTTTPATAQAAGQWEGLGGAYPGFSITAVPPDPNMAVGPNDIVQWVNNAFVVFDKQGHQLLAPVADSTFWANASCNQAGGFSDPIVQYDRVADRWIVAEVALPYLAGLIGQYAQCFAVSQTNDPTGAYYMWGYGFGSNINDYDKITVWPDGYYVTWNIFSGSGAFVGPEACAWDRAGMIAGAAAPSYVCFKLGGQYASLLPSDLDGSRAPPTGSPNFLLSIDPASKALYLWKFHVDYAQPNNSTFTGVSVPGVAPFTSPCLSTQDCIPQPATAQKLDALGDRLMYRVAYRNFGDHESVVANHSVVATGGNIGVRWYEIRNPAGSPTIYQQSTFAPDTDNRWMASVAMDQSGNIGVGYSVSSGATYPSIRFTGWEVGNPLGTLQNETFAVAGTGSQTGYNRWGDYSAMRIDPADDCTFWYTQEYETVTTSVDWNTRIVSFKFQSCGVSLAPTTTGVTSSLNPSMSGDSVTFTATVSPSAATGSVQFFDGATSLGSVALSGGVAATMTSTLSVGSHNITAVYSGDSSYATSTSAALTQVVNGVVVSTMTSLSSSPNPSMFGQSVALVATVTPTSGITTPTGSVTFLDGTTVLGAQALNSSGVATLSTSSLGVGPHSITAKYGGDSTDTVSTSNTVSQTVNQANTTTKLTSSRNPSSTGSAVTFTATVSPSGATGTVQFFNGAVSLGTTAVTNGKATLTTSSLSSGTHSITAQYSGDGNYNGSTSSVLNQTVGRRRQ